MSCMNFVRVVRGTAPTWVVLALLSCGSQSQPYNPPLECDLEAPAVVGVSPLRRLTGVEYDYTVQDLFGVTGAYAALLDPDEEVGAFASNAVTPVSRVVVERYMETAEAVAADADLEAVDDCNLFVTPPEECAAEFIEVYGPLALRRPLTEEEREAYQALFETYGMSDYRNGLRVLVQALLQSPHFLYHMDFEESGDSDVGTMTPLSGFALASRLSYFLWSSAPDSTLLDAAEAGVLQSREGLQAQALRMLADPKAKRGIGSFHRQWLGVSSLETIAKDAELFPGFDDEIRAALKQETVDFADYVVRFGDGELTTLLTADFSVVTPPLFAFYGLDGEPSSDPMVVNLGSTGRAGVLTHGSVLASHAHYQRSSLTLRGKLIRENLFCESLPDPPPDVDLKLPELGEGATTRDLVEAHSSEPACAGCHSLTDPIGFGLEHFDAIGQYRDSENGGIVDDAGEIVGTDVAGEFHGVYELTDILAQSEQVEWCVTRQWFRYALGRSEQSADGCSLQEANEAMSRPGNLRELIVAIVISDAFRYRSSESGGE